MFENLIIAIFACTLTLYIQHLIRIYPNLKTSLINNNEKILLCISTLFILITLVLPHIGRWYIGLDPSIKAALIGVFGALIAAILASYGTMRFTKRKEAKEKQERILYTKKSLLDILEKIYLIVITSEKESLEEICKNLKNNLYKDIDPTDKRILGVSIFESISSKDLLEMCNYYDLEYHLFFGSISTYPQLYELSALRVNQNIFNSILSIKLELNIPVMSSEGYLINHEKIVSFKENKTLDLEGLISSFETYIKDTEDLISLLKNV